MIKCCCFIRQILSTLRILPINNKTVLEDSKVLSVVQKWAVQIASSSATQSNDDQSGRETENEMSDTPSRSETPMSLSTNATDSPLRDAKPSSELLATPITNATTSVTTSSSTNVTTPVTNPTSTDIYECIPNKKRRLLDRLKAEESSSDSEFSDSSKLSSAVLAKTEETTNNTEAEKVTVNPDAQTDSKTDKPVKEVTIASIDDQLAELGEIVIDKPSDSAENQCEVKAEEGATVAKPEAGAGGDGVMGREEGEIVEEPTTPTAGKGESKELNIASLASDLLKDWSGLKVSSIRISC